MGSLTELVQEGRLERPPPRSQLELTRLAGEAACEPPPNFSPAVDLPGDRRKRGGEETREALEEEEAEGGDKLVDK